MTTPARSLWLFSFLSTCHHTPTTQYMTNVDCRERTPVATLVYWESNRQYWCICQQHHQTDGQLTDTPNLHISQTNELPKWRLRYSAVPSPIVRFNRGASVWMSSLATWKQPNHAKQTSHANNKNDYTGVRLDWFSSQLALAMPKLHDNTRQVLVIVQFFVHLSSYTNNTIHD